MTMDIDAILESQHAFFKSGTTLDPRWRSERLKELARALDKWEKPLCDALWADLHKSANEAFLTEIALVRSEISSAARSVRRWARREKVSTPIACMPSRSYIVKEPLGTALIVSPWNYPVQLLLNPLVGAIAAGCTAVLKPSPYVPNVSETIERMLSETFPKEYIAVVQGNREINRKLFSCRWDIIFFTGKCLLKYNGVFLYCGAFFPRFCCPVVQSPAEAKRKIGFLAFYNLVKRHLKNLFAAAKPIMPIAKPFNPCFLCKFCLLFSDYRKS